MIFLKMQRNLKLKGKRKKEKFTWIVRAKAKWIGLHKYWWTYYVVREKRRWRWNGKNRHEGCRMLCFRNGTRWAMNLSDRVAKAKGSSKTLRDHMKEQHILSEIAENSHPIQESESGRENASESTAIEGQRNFTNQESQHTGEQNRTMPRTTGLSTTEECNG